MTFVVPNAGDTTSGNRYEAIDQAEPDALDFEVLGNQGSGVVSGCVVTSNNSSSNVAVSAGTVVLNGVVYPIAAAAALSIPAAPADNRFDLVVVRVTAGVAALTVLQGTNSATNPQYPKSAAVLSGGAGANNFIESTDVLLAALYRTGASPVTTSRIVDKTMRRYSTIVNQGSGTPLTNSLPGPGSFYFQTSQPSGTGSGVWVQTSNGEMVELAQNVGSHIPIGGMFMWPTDAPVPAGCVEANGQGLAVSAYNALFDQYAYKHGGSGATFNVPDMNDRYPLGTNNPALTGTTVGANSFTLSVAQLPVHTHTLNNHTHTFAHSHGIDHTHAGSNTGSSSVSGTTGASVSNTRGYLYGSSSVYIESFYDFQEVARLGGWPTSGDPGILYGDIAGVARLNPNSPLWAPQQMHVWDYNGHTHTFSGGSHTHSIPALGYVGSTTSQSTSTTSGSSALTSATGSGTTIDNRPASLLTRFLIRASLGSATDSGATINPARVFTLGATLESPTAPTETFIWVAAFTCTLKKIRAYREDGSTLAVNIRINNSDSVLATDLETPAADTWYFEATDYAIDTDDVIEVEVTESTGGITLAYIQLDLET